MKCIFAPKCKQIRPKRTQSDTLRGYFSTLDMFFYTSVL